MSARAMRIRLRTACSTGRTTRGRKCLKAGACRRCCCPVTTPTSAAGGSRRRWPAPCSAGPTCWRTRSSRPRRGAHWMSSWPHARLAANIEVTDMSKIIQEIEKQRMTRQIPDFKPGDTVVVQVKVVEGDRERVQAYEGVVIARSNRGLNSSFTVRKISHGEGVERVFQTPSPAISEISAKRRGNVRRAKPYSLGHLSGKAARIEEKIGSSHAAAFVFFRPVARPGRPAQGPAPDRA